VDQEGKTEDDDPAEHRRRFVQPMPEDNVLPSHCRPQCRALLPWTAKQLGELARPSANEFVELI